MEYDNKRERNLYGYDAGNIVDGQVVLDPSTNEYVILDEDGVAFSTQKLLKSLDGQKVRITCISFESIEKIEQMLVNHKDDVLS
jgi:hypothetical protein